MKRIAEAYGAKLRKLLRRVGARRMEKAVVEVCGRGAEADSPALERAYQTVRRRVAPFLRRREGALPAAPWFVCDVGLGGLARWLRGAGYMAWWREGVGDAELITEARARRAILLTTDSGMMERGILRDGQVPAIWVSPGLTKMQQLESILIDLDLPLLAPRCMKMRRRTATGAQGRRRRPHSGQDLEVAR